MSCRNVFNPGADIAVRSRLMKAVFFFSEESSDGLTLKRSEVT